MATITMTTTAALDNVTSGTITPSVLDSFIAFIDRSEKTARTYIVNLRQFFAWLAYSGLYDGRSAAPTRQDIISYRQWLTAEHDAIQLAPETSSGWKYRMKNGHPVRVSCKPSTIKLYLQSVRQLFSWTAASGIYPNVAANVHAPKVTTDTHKKATLTASEVLTIEQSIIANGQTRSEAAAAAAKDTEGRTQRSTEQSARLYAMYLLAVNAGLRTVEISRANVRDLEIKDGRAWLYIWGKGHTEADQKKPLAPEVAAAIKEYLTTRTDAPTGTSPLFVSTGNRSHGKRIAPTTISTMLKKAMKEAGFDSERLTAHSLRHTAGNTVRQLTGDNIYLTQKYMRHSNPATTEIYMHDNETDTGKQADIAQQLYNAYHGQSTGSASPLENMIMTMTPAQLEQMTRFARAIS